MKRKKLKTQAEKKSIFEKNLCDLGSKGAD